MVSFSQPGSLAVPVGCYYLHQANEGAGLDHINLLTSTSQDTTVTTGWTALFAACVRLCVCVCVCVRAFVRVCVVSPSHMHIEAASPT